MTWVEALIPLVICTGAIAAMGSLQSVVDRATFGSKKKVQKDHFSHLMEKRDKRIREEQKEIDAKGK